MLWPPAPMRSGCTRGRRPKDAPVDPGALASVVGLLGACLVALVLVLVARREAGVQRARGAEDVAAIKDEARALLADAERRDRRSIEREHALEADRADIDGMQRAARSRLDAATQEL